MATNEEEETTQPTRAEVLSEFFGPQIARATDTTPNTPLTLRVWVLLVVLAGVVATTPFPGDIIGAVALVALALTLALRLRTPR